MTCALRGRLAQATTPLFQELEPLFYSVREVVPFVGGLLSDKRAYAYLPASTAYLPPTGELLHLIANHGFEQVTQRTFGFGAAQLITGTRS